MSKKSSTFVVEMKIRLLILCLCFALCARAETILLRTGARVNGTIVFQNEEVVIIRDAEGARFQYPRSDVQEIIADSEKLEQQTTAAEQNETETINTGKKASILLELAGGLSSSVSAAYSADLLVGTHHIGARHLFVGGGLGYHGQSDGFNFLPVQAALRLPLTEAKHAPVFGVGIGYGIALSKNYIGGIYTGLDFGYRCQLNPKTAIGVVAFARFQQAKISTKEKIEDTEFTNYTGRNLFSYGLKFTLYF